MIKRIVAGKKIQSVYCYFMERRDISIIKGLEKQVQDVEMCVIVASVERWDKFVVDKQIMTI